MEILPLVELGGIFYPGVPGATEEGDGDADGVCGSDGKVEERDGKENGQNLLDVGCGGWLVSIKRSVFIHDVPATVMLSGPTFPLAEKLTTLRPNAMHPLTRRTTACESGTPPTLRDCCGCRQPRDAAVVLKSALPDRCNCECVIVASNSCAETDGSWCIMPKRERWSSSPESWA